MRIIFLFVLSLLILIPAQAQECCPRAEFSAGYAYFNTDPKGDNINANSFTNRYGQNGIAFSGAINHSKRFGAVADFSYHWREATIESVKTNTSTFNFLFGPRFSSRSDGFTSFFHVLVGGIKRKNEAANRVMSTTSFALGIGGGANIEVSKSFGIRLFQIDYLPSRAEVSAGQTAWSHNFRLQAGITLKIGQIE